MNPPNRDLIAAIDIGTNSAHLVIAHVDEVGNLDIIDTDKVILRLGESLEQHGGITEEACHRTIEALKRFQSFIAAYPNAIVRVVATHAIRNSENAQYTIDKIAEKTGLQVEIVDGLEEARLVFSGIHHGLDLRKNMSLAVDIGGGSTEIIVGASESDIAFAASLKIGAVTLSKKFARSDSSIDILSLEDFLAERILPLQTDLSKLEVDQAIISSGTAKALAAIHSEKAQATFSKEKHGYSLSSEDIFRIGDEIAALNNPIELVRRYDIDLARAEIMLTGTLILSFLAKIISVKTWTISTFGLREGLVVDTFRKSCALEAKISESVTLESFHKLGHRFGIDQDHAEHIMRLAMCIYDLIAPFCKQNHALDAFISERELLRASAYLHEIGKFIGYSKYHKHGFYIVSNTSMLGYTQAEKSAVALIIRYHRKSLTPLNRKQSLGFHPRQVERIMFLATILRLAVAMNRTRRKLVTGVDVSMKEQRVQLKLLYDSALVPSVELHSLEHEAQLFQKGIGWPMDFVLDSKDL